MLLTGKENLSGSANNNSHLQRFFDSVISVLMSSKQKDPDECVLAGVGSCSTGETSSINRTTEKAGISWCMFIRQTITLRELVHEPSYRSFSWQALERCFSLFGIRGSFGLKMTNFYVHDHEKVTFEHIRAN